MNNPGGLVEYTNLQGLKRGSGYGGDEKNNARVMRLQEILNIAQGATPQLVIDGLFGDLTEEQVQLFQQANGLKTTGVVDEKTDKLLQDDDSRSIGQAPLTKVAAGPDGLVVAGVVVGATGAVVAVVGGVKKKRALMWAGVGGAVVGFGGAGLRAFMRRKVKAATGT